MHLENPISLKKILPTTTITDISDSRHHGTYLPTGRLIELTEVLNKKASRSIGGVTESVIASVAGRKIIDPMTGFRYIITHTGVFIVASDDLVPLTSFDATDVRAIRLSASDAESLMRAILAHG